MERAIIATMLAMLLQLSAGAARAAQAPDKVVFVCTGNTCRSPMAEGIAKKTAAEKDYDIEIVSRGTKIDPAEIVANPDAIFMMAVKGIKIDGHQSREMSAKDAQDAVLILTMTENHKKNVLSHFPDASPYTFTLIEYATGASGNISDPWGLGLVDYCEIAGQLEKLIPIALEKFVGSK